MEKSTARIIVKASVVAFVILLAALVFILYPHATGNRDYREVRVTTFSKDFINVHLVSMGDSHLLIEAGLPAFAEDIEAFLLANHVEPAELDAIILTHAHHDHVGSARHFQQRHKVRVIGGKADLVAFQSGENGILCPTSLLAKVRHQSDQAGRFPPLTPNILVDTLLDLSSISDIDGLVHSVPGHTNGSLVVVLGDIAFVGDLFRGGLFIKSAAAMHFYQCNLQGVMAGIETLLHRLAPDATTFFPSHLGPTTRESLEKMLFEMAQE